MTSLAKWFEGKAAAARIHYNWWRVSMRRGLRRNANQRRLNRISEELSVCIDANVGLFAHLSWCVKIVAYCERNNLTPRITCVSKQYGEHGRDWFNILFDHPTLRKAPASLRKPHGRHAATLRIFDYEELPFYASQNLESTLAEATRLQRTYFPVAKHVTSKVDDYVARHFLRGGKTIGCHYRGTDKGGIEATRIAYAEMTNALRTVLSKVAGPAMLFVATDETAFLDHIRVTFPETPVISAEHQRSTDGRALHFQRELHGIVHAEEALTDCLLLSRCDMLVKSPSALSAWAKVFNPDLPMTLVGRPYAHTMFFPESALYSAK